MSSARLKKFGTCIDEDFLDFYKRPKFGRKLEEAYNKALRIFFVLKRQKKGRRKRFETLKL